MKKILNRFRSIGIENLDRVKYQLQVVRRRGFNFPFSTANFNRSAAAVSIFILFIAFSACSTKEEHEHAEHAEASTTYTCPMHPQIVEQEPGSCPICGMDLVPVSVEAEDIEVTPDLNVLLKAADKGLVSDVKTVKPVLEEKDIIRTFPGVIAYDTRHTYSLPIRYSGRIEKLYVNYNFQPIEKGQKLLEIYSPELLTAQRELVFLLKTDPENTSLIEAATQKLRLLGVNNQLIKQLIRTGEVLYSVPVYSPYNGYIAEVEAVASQNRKKGMPLGGGMGGMSTGMAGGGSSISGAPQQGVPSELSLQEGMYVEPGQGLFRIIDASQLWAEFNVSAEEAVIIEEGDPIEISWGPGKEQQLQAEVNLIQPFFSKGEDFSKLRVYLDNTDLRVGQLVEGEVLAETESSLWVPALAVLDLGNRDVVYVKQEGILRPKEISTGIRANDWVQVKEGLTAEDNIAHNAQFLIDGE